MAHGLPDYYRGVDIAYQALSEMIVRPKYGGGIGAFGSLTVTASTLNTLVSISGKGMVYGGAIFLDYTATQKDSMPKLEIDGNLLAGGDFAAFDKWQMNLPGCLAMSLLKYDDTNFIYVAGISYGLTFETGVKLQYQEMHGTTPKVYYNLFYALI